MPLSITTELQDLVDLLAREKVEYALCGGLEGLTQMKRLAGRHQDLADLENLGIEIESDE